MKTEPEIKLKGRSKGQIEEQVLDNESVGGDNMSHLYQAVLVVTTSVIKDKSKSKLKIKLKNMPNNKSKSKSKIKPKKKLKSKVKIKLRSSVGGDILSHPDQGKKQDRE
eukprot:2863950-Ditylum_brightwellii.AAC.1